MYEKEKPIEILQRTSMLNISDFRALVVNSSNINFRRKLQYFKTSVLQDIKTKIESYEMQIKNEYINEQHPDRYLDDQNYKYYMDVTSNPVKKAFSDIGVEIPDSKKGYDFESNSEYDYYYAFDVVSFFKRLDEIEFFLATKSYKKQIGNKSSYFEKDFCDSFNEYSKKWDVDIENIVRNESRRNNNVLKEKVNEFIKRGEEIKSLEYHPANSGFISYISGPKFDAWMGEINIFNKRYLKKHPLYNSINTTYFHYKNNVSSCDDMLGNLRALASDSEFFNDIYERETATATPAPKIVRTIPQLISEDIIRCEQYLSNPTDEDFGRSLYIEITGRYDSIISGFGQGLYSYIHEYHFYDTDVSIDTITHNLKLLLQKMIAYQSARYSTLETKRREQQKIMSNKIFIVHGHDTAAKLEMARTLENADFEAIILHEQASVGKTVIEKIEANTDVSFAVVLYTQCDMGRAIGAKVDEERYRARQNVVFEHGYLIGKLGRECVCALVKGNIETPSDISGVVYITMDDAGAWKMKLAKEMKSTGLPVDMNKFCL